jgi:peptide/nickel transport system substrate-binding protein
MPCSGFVRAAAAKAPPHRADLAQTDPYGHGHTGYCNPEVDKLIDQQSAEADPAKRKQLVWQIERRLAEDGARPIIFYPRGETCTQPYVTGLVTMVNSIYNGYRMEDVWLDK